MSDIVYIYGSARNSATRAVRHSVRAQREMQTHIGPWTIRPSRRTPVEFVQLAKYERDVIEKVTNGVVQIQNGDTATYSLNELIERFDALRGTKGAPNFMTMPFAELMGLMRSEAPGQAVWDAFVERSLSGEGAEEADLPTRITALTEYALANKARLNVTRSLQLIHAALKPEARVEPEKQEPTEPDPTTIKAEPEPEKQEPESEDVGTITDTDTEESAEPEPSEDPEQMDFSEPELAEPEDETAEPESREGKLPEGWRTFTNSKLAELLTELDIELPERQNKASFVAAVEAWLGGS